MNDEHDEDESGLFEDGFEAEYLTDDELDSDLPDAPYGDEIKDKEFFEGELSGDNNPELKDKKDAHNLISNAVKLDTQHHSESVVERAEQHQETIKLGIVELLKTDDDIRQLIDTSIRLHSGSISFAKAIDELREVRVNYETSIRVKPKTFSYKLVFLFSFFGTILGFAFSFLVLWIIGRNY